MDMEVDLNQTDDFASGTTPYKLAALKTVINNVTKPTKTKRRGPKVTNANTRAASSSSTEKGMEKSKFKTPVDSGKDMDAVEEKNSVVDYRTCRCCHEEVPLKEYSTHLNVCLNEKYSRKKKQLNSSKQQAKEEVLCQICHTEITSLSPNERNRHVNDCIDGKSIGAKAVPESECGTNDNKQSCHICQEDLSSMFDSGRLLHINACVDRKERQKPRQSKPKVTKEKVLDCPLCGQPLKTQNSRKTHMKSCAKKLDVDTATLMARIKQQEDEHQKGKLLNTGGITEIGLTKSKRPPRGRGGRPGSEAPRPTCVERALEEETQVALAMSNSLVESGKNFETNTTNNNANNRVKDAYAVLMSPSTKPKQKKNRKKHRDPEFTPTLLVETQEETANKLARKIDLIMTGSQEKGEINCTPEFKESGLKEVYNPIDSNKKDSDLKPRGLWASSTVDPSTVRSEDFYVKKITPPIEVSSFAIGPKFSKMSKIAGWSSLNEKDVLDKTRRESLLNESVVPSTQTAVVLAQLAGDHTTMLQPADLTLTQADLTCGVNKDYQDQSKRNQDGQKEETVGNGIENFKETTEFLNRTSHSIAEPRGFMATVENSKQNERTKNAVQNLLEHFSSFINNREQSDVTIQAADGREIFVHTFILNIRCPALLKMCENGVINLENINQETILTLLRYVYAANVIIPPTQLLQMKTLAERFDLDELKQVCEELITEDDTVVEEDNEGKPGCSRHPQSADETLQNLLNHVWGSDADSSSDESEKGSATDERINEGSLNSEVVNDEEYEEMFEVMTQRNRRESANDGGSEEEGFEGSEERGFERSKSTKKKSTYLEIIGVHNLNMTLHEQMTRALLCEVESEGNQSDVSVDLHQSECKSQNTDSSNESEVNDGDVSANDSVSIVDVQLCSVTQNVDISRDSCSFLENELGKSPEPSTSSETEILSAKKSVLCSLIDTPRTQKPRSVSVHSATPDLFQDSPEFDRSLSVKNNSLVKQSVKPVGAARLPSPVHVSSEQSKNTSVAVSRCSSRSREYPILRDLPKPTSSIPGQSENKQSKGDKSQRKIHDISDSGDDCNAGSSLQNSPTKSDSGSCEIVKEFEGIYTDECTSPVLQSQAGEGISSEGSRKAVSKKIVRNLSENFSPNNRHSRKKHDTKLNKSDSQPNQPSETFGKSALYNSSVKYSPRFRSQKSGVSRSMAGRNLGTSYSSEDIPVISPNRKRKVSEKFTPEKCQKKKRHRRRSSQNEKRKSGEMSDSSVEFPVISSQKRKMGEDVSSGLNHKKQRLAFSPDRFSGNHSQKNHSSSSSVENDNPLLKSPRQCCDDQGNGNDKPNEGGNRSPLIDLTSGSGDEENIEANNSVVYNEHNSGDNSLFPESPEAHVANDADVWDGFEDDGWNEMCYVSPQIQPAGEHINNTSPGMCSKSQAMDDHKGSLNIPENSPDNTLQDEGINYMDHLDLGSSFTESQQSQKCSTLRARSPEIRLSCSPKHSTGPRLMNRTAARIDAEADVDVTMGAKSPSAAISPPRNKSLSKLIPDPRSPSFRFRKNLGNGEVKKTAEKSSLGTAMNVAETYRRTNFGDGYGSSILDDSIDIDNKNESSLLAYDPPTDISMNESVADHSLRRFDASSNANKGSFKTPSKRMKKRPEEWVPPSPFTPMPDYSSLPTPQIQKMADKIGLKAFPKKRQIAVLKSVYEATHTYESDPEFDQDAVREIRKDSSPEPCTSDLPPKPAKGKTKKGDAKKGGKGQKQRGKIVDDSTSTETDGSRNVKSVNAGRRSGSKIAAKKDEKNSQESSVARSTDNDWDYDSDTSMGKSDREDVLEETVLQSSPSKNLSKRDVNYKRQQMWDFIKSRDDIYIKVLHFEPLEFDEFHTQLKESGLGVGTNIVSEFLDDKGIMYTMRKLRQEKPTWQKKRKKAKKLTSTSASQASS